MKKFLSIFLIPVFALALLMGCKSVPDGVSFTVYRSNDNADGFLTREVTVEELAPEVVVCELIADGVLPDDVAVQAFAQEGTALSIDCNGAFANHVRTMGTAGETMIIGSVVNTFLGAYGAESLLLTVDGQPLETGHNIYDLPLTFQE